MAKLKDPILGVTTFFMFRTHDLAGRKYKKPVKEIAVCKDCKKVFTKECQLIAIDLDRDYCSRMELGRNSV